MLARLEREGLEPSPEEGRGGLLRRLSFDLTGLPPSPSELDAFESDPRPDAYERVVDRLLASPRFGERMAIRWLNAARYADTSGYQTDGERVMWRWRDWVIEAYNRNLPFDEFTIDQLAGDLIPGATLDQKIATGFNRNHRGNSEGGIIPEEYAVEYVADRVETTATVWLGLTIGCARCHNHKFDPVSQGEFYRLFAFFNNVPENGRASSTATRPRTSNPPRRPSRSNWPRSTSQLADGPRPGRGGRDRAAGGPGLLGKDARVAAGILMVAEEASPGEFPPGSRSASLGRSPGGRRRRRVRLPRPVHALRLDPPRRAEGRNDPLPDARRAEGRGLFRWSSTTGRSRSTW